MTALKQTQRRKISALLIIAYAVFQETRQLLLGACFAGRKNFRKATVPFNGRHQLQSVEPVGSKFCLDELRVGLGRQYRIQIDSFATLFVKRSEDFVGCAVVFEVEPGLD